METDPEELVYRVARRIAELRVRSGRTQEDVATELGVSPRWVRRVEEKGENLTLHTLARLASALGVKVAALPQEPSLEARPTRPGRPKKRRKTAGT